MTSLPTPPRRIIRRPEDALAVLTSAPGARRLPPDLLRQVSRRLEIMAPMAAALWVLGPVLRHLALHAASPGDPRWAQLLPVDAVAVAGFAASLGLWWYLRRGCREPGLVLNLALVYLVATAFAIGVLIHWGPPPGETMSPGPTITWIGPMILMFAAIVPVPPSRMLGAGLVAASMDPLGMLIWKAAGHYEFGAPSNLLFMHFPTYLLLGVAVVISHVVTRLGYQVTRERAMGSYQLGELLGEGGMGEVYRATHRMLARPAAIKLIRPEVLAARDQATAQLAMVRFRREAEAAANLRSPHTVELYDFGVTEDGTLYTVMELLEGMTLQALVGRYGPVPAGRVIHILRQVCESLEEAHASGLVHRDIKPANVHLGRLGLVPDFVKVLDFGLVKSAAAPSLHHSLATVAGLTPGTPAYMAPEMAGEETIDGRADLYALGCVAYYLLTGQLVFEAATPLQVIARHLQETPVAPSRRTENPVPPALDRLVLACLEKHPADRPRSAAEVARALAAVPVAPWSAEQATRWWDTHDRPSLTPVPANGILTLSAGIP